MNLKSTTTNGFNCRMRNKSINGILWDTLDLA